MKRNLFLLLLFLASLWSAGAVARNVVKTDVCVYGGTSAGVIAAYTAIQQGKKAVLIEPSHRIGGMTTGGLGWTDIGNKGIIKGLALDFYTRIGKEYGKTGPQFTFEPKVALKVYQQYVDEAKMQVVYNYRIVLAEKSGSKIKRILLESTNGGQPMSVKAKVLIDCSYEGDLMARAGVSYTVGREANSVYGETINGVEMRNKHQFPDGVDPYRVKGDPQSGLLYGILPDEMGKNGTGDNHVQAYNFRITLTDKPDNMIPLQKPERYNPDHYELLLRLIEKKPKPKLSDFLKFDMMPNRKTDINNQGAFSTDMIGANWDYPDADYAKREAIYRDHMDYTLGLLWFLGHDERVPEQVRKGMCRWGLPKDEYSETGHFTPQLYIREARRMIGRMVMTEDYCRKKKSADDPIAWAAYNMDSHNCGRYVVNGMVKNEGDVQVKPAGIYNVSYRAITPKEEEATNLLVPVCLSASHIAYGSIRMEPVFMVLGQSSALAACQAIDHTHGIVQKVDSRKVIEKL